MPTNVPPGSVEDISFWVQAVRYHVRVGVDKNRDGSIDLDGTNDLTTAASPYVFWINNDNDKLGNPFSGGSEIDWFDATSSGVSGIPNDYAWNIIHTERDLEDFTRVDIRLPAVDFGTNWEVHLTFSGQLKFFELPSPYTGFEHLTDQTLANLLVYSNSTQWYVGEANGGMMVLPQRLFTNSGGACRLLVEGGAPSADACRVNRLAPATSSSLLRAVMEAFQTFLKKVLTCACFQGRTRAQRHEILGDISDKSWHSARQPKPS
ncbi:MAG: hypothetical protein EBS05_08265 [Proteobacteria bacterium]|nr:hypothetical protein [Pseudomonadota bacterium]